MTYNEADMDELVSVVADAEYYEGEDEAWPDWLGESSTDDLLEMMEDFKTEGRRIAKVRTELGERLASHLGLGGKITDGGTFYRYATPGKRYVVDRELMWRMVAINPAAAFNENDLRIGAFRELAKQYAIANGYEEGEEADAEAEALERRVFSHRPHGAPKVTASAMEYAPLYARDMEPGRIYKKGDKI